MFHFDIPQYVDMGHPQKARIFFLQELANKWDSNCTKPTEVRSKSVTFVGINLIHNNNVAVGFNGDAVKTPVVAFFMVNPEAMKVYCLGFTICTSRDKVSVPVMDLQRIIPKVDQLPMPSPNLEKNTFIEEETVWPDLMSAVCEKMNPWDRYSVPFAKDDELSGVTKEDILSRIMWVIAEQCKPEKVCINAAPFVMANSDNEAKVSIMLGKVCKGLLQLCVEFKKEIPRKHVEAMRVYVESRYWRSRFQDTFNNLQKTLALLSYNGFYNTERKISGLGDRKFFWDPKLQDICAKVRFTDCPGNLMRNPVGGWVVIHRKDFVDLFWHWHMKESESFGLKAAYNGMHKELHSICMGLGDLILFTHEEQRRRELETDRKNLWKGPMSDQPPDLEKLPPCYRDYLQKKLYSGSWLKDNIRPDLARLFKNSGYSLEAFLRFCTQFLGHGATVEQVRKKYNPTTTWNSERRYLSVGCKQIMESTSNNGNLAMKCPYAKLGFTSGCSKCRERAISENPHRKPRSFNNLTNPTQWLRWSTPRPSKRNKHTKKHITIEYEDKKNNH